MNELWFMANSYNTRKDQSNTLQRRR